MKSLILVLALAFSTSAFAGAGVNSVGTVGIVNTVNTANTATLNNGVFGYVAASKLTYNGSFNDLNKTANIVSIYNVLTQAGAVDNALPAKIWGLLTFTPAFKDIFTGLWGSFTYAAFMANYDKFSAIKWNLSNGIYYIKAGDKFSYYSATVGYKNISNIAN